MGAKTNKAQYFEKLKGLLEQYKSIFIVTVDNVSFSKQSAVIAVMAMMGKGRRLTTAFPGIFPTNARDSRLVEGRGCCAYGQEHYGAPCHSWLDLRLSRVRASAPAC